MVFKIPLSTVLAVSVGLTETLSRWDAQTKTKLPGLERPHAMHRGATTKPAQVENCVFVLTGEPKQKEGSSVGNPPPQ